jgi:hypothetical protein
MSFILNPYYFAPAVEPETVILESLYSTDFQDDTIGTVPAAWFVNPLWSTGTLTKAWGVDIAADTPVNTQALEFKPSTWDWWAARIVDSELTPDCDLLFRTRWTAIATNTKSYAILRGSGVDDDRNGYLFTLGIGTADPGVDTFGIWKLTNDVGSNIGTPAVVSFAADQWVWIRARAVGDRFQGKVWADGDPEPSAWMVDAVDPSPFLDGWAGVGARSGGHNYWFDDVTFSSAAEILPWTPALISTALWLDAADATTITESGGAVSAMADKSGNARNFSQATGSLQPTTGASTQNGLNVLDFAADYLTSTDPVGEWTFMHDGTKHSAFCVIAVGDSSNPNAFYGIAGNNRSSTANPGWSLYYDDRLTQTRNDRLLANVTNGAAGLASSSNLTADDFAPAQTFTLVGVEADPSNVTASLRSVLRANGGAIVAQNNVDTTSPVATAPNYAVQIGAVGDGVGALVGKIAEVIFVEGEISTATRQRMEGYLAHKWGLEGDLPSGHPYKNSPPTQQWTIADATTALWLDAADATTITEASGVVSEWSDKSGNGYDVSQATPGARPVVSAAAQNGLDAIAFDGTDDLLTTSVNFPITGNSEFAIFLAGKPALGSTEGIVVGWGANGVLEGVGTTRGALAYMGGNNYNMSTLLAEDTPVQTAYTKTPGAIDATSAWFKNGASNDGTGHSTSTPNTIARPFVVGRLNEFAFFQEGETYEVVVLDYAPDTATRQRIEGYLAHKWGLEGDLPENHPYKVQPPRAEQEWVPELSDMWFDATDASSLVTSGSVVTAWRDKGKRGSHMYLTNTPLISTSPSLDTINGLTAVEVDSSSDRLVAAGSPIGHETHIFTVAQRPVGATRAILFGDPTTFRFVGCMDNGNTSTFITGAFGGTGYINGTALPTGTRDELYDAFNTGSPVLYGQVGGFNGSWGLFAINGYNSTSWWPNCKYGEIIIVRGELSVANRQRIEGYLAHKWGIEAGLPADHPFKAAPPF